jgi:hypothetical protein
MRETAGASAREVLTLPPGQLLRPAHQTAALAGSQLAVPQETPIVLCVTQQFVTCYHRWGLRRPYNCPLRPSN